jgi:hypothetical protein
MQTMQIYWISNYPEQTIQRTQWKSGAENKELHEEFHRKMPNIHFYTFEKILMEINFSLRARRSGHFPAPPEK